MTPSSRRRLSVILSRDSWLMQTKVELNACSGFDYICHFHVPQTIKIMHSPSPSLDRPFCCFPLAVRKGRVRQGCCSMSLTRSNITSRSCAGSGYSWVHFMPGGWRVPISARVKLQRSQITAAATPIPAHRANRWRLDRSKKLSVVLRLRDLPLPSVTHGEWPIVLLIWIAHLRLWVF